MAKQSPNKILETPELAITPLLPGWVERQTRWLKLLSATSQICLRLVKSDILHILLVIVGTQLVFNVKVLAFNTGILPPEAALIGNHDIRRC
jgi:hypothetical protein